MSAVLLHVNYNSLIKFNLLVAKLAFISSALYAGGDLFFLVVAGLETF